MAYADGYTGQEMITEYLGITHIQETDAIGIASALRAINASQLAMYGIGYWPIMVIPDAYITTDGSNYYDLSTDILKDPDGNALTGQFGRLVPNTIRCGTEPLTLASHGMITQHDPDYTVGGGGPTHYALINKKKLFLYSTGSDGDTVTFDFMGLPFKITASTTAAQISFEPENHWLISEGAQFFGLKAHRGNDWVSQYKLWEKRVKQAIGMSKPVSGGTVSFMPQKI